MVYAIFVIPVWADADIMYCVTQRELLWHQIIIALIFRVYLGGETRRGGGFIV